MGAFDVWSSGVDPDFVVTTQGPVPPAEVTRVVRGLGRILRRHGVEGPVRARLHWPDDEDEATLVQASVRALGKAFRVQVAGPGKFASTFALERLDMRLSCSPDELSRPWPDPSRPNLAVVTEPRPIVRRKDCRLQVMTSVVAAQVLDAMDYDAHLFVDAETGTDAVVCWTGPLGVRTVRRHRDPVPTLLDDEAGARLCLSGLPYLFYTDPDSRRGRLLYRRFDGDLSLVTALGAEDRARERGLQPRAIATCVRRPLSPGGNVQGAVERLA
ncbi:sigma 54 modulation/S30EA ribosomal C-terminal domain-containing protein [Nocardia jejuensis]|uniref:sigma 54 modulation/S30EA ribosomal C-terminal domain-containing protein n=1 Tax=Nocardia jejuensis TaxID=328049 RepID=UPI000829EACE|nr:sigma 54 modulation/S30EA ribosomal C-terminal domain-containing protein [Nocardia jejuensis]